MRAELHCPRCVALARQRKFDDAEPLLIRAYEGMKKREEKVPADARQVRLKETLQRLLQLYEAWNKHDEVAEWKERLIALDSAAK